jgi:hypothetical protein
MTEAMRPSILKGAIVNKAAYGHLVYPQLSLAIHDISLELSQVFEFPALPISRRDMERKRIPLLYFGCGTVKAKIAVPVGVEIYVQLRIHVEKATCKKNQQKGTHGTHFRKKQLIYTFLSAILSLWVKTAYLQRWRQSTTLHSAGRFKDEIAWKSC